MIFGVVTAEIAKEFVDSLRCHDRGKIFEDVVQRSGVTLYMSDDKKDIRLQGFWDSVKDAHDLLEGEYGGLVPTQSPDKNGCGRQLPRDKRMAAMATKPWPSQGPRVPDKTRVLPRGETTLSPHTTKSPWKLMKKWPKAPDPVIIFEGVGPGMIGTADLLSKGNKEEIRKAIEVVTRSSAVPSTSTVQQFPSNNEPPAIPDNNDAKETSSNQLDNGPKVEEKPDMPASHENMENVDDGDDHDDAVGDVDDDNNDENDSNKTKDNQVDNSAKTKPNDADEKGMKQEKAGSEAEVIDKPTKVKTGPQTRGNKRKAGRPRKIPIKTVSSDEAAQDDSDSDYTTNTKRSSKRKRLPVRKSLRRRVPTKRQTTAASDVPVVKRKRGRPRKSGNQSDSFTCKDCDFTGKNRGQLKNHRRRVHGGAESGSCRCPVCDKQFSFEKDMKRHMMRHVDTRYPCEICGRVYKDRKTMLTHKERHNEGYVPPSFPCDQCNKTFCTKYILSNHIKSEHLGLKRMFLCPTCGKSFTQKHAYLQHANVHLGIKPFVCEVCNKAFAYEKSLKEHKFMHQEAKNFVCEVCSKAFRQKSALVVHAKIHKPTKDFLCSVCSKGFTQKQALLRHERVHNGEKPYACGICGRSFSDKSIIRRHMILVHKRDSKQWKENTFEEQKKRSDYFVTPKLGSEMEEEITKVISNTSIDTSVNMIRSMQPMPQASPTLPPPVSVEQRETNPVTSEPLPVSPVPMPPRLPSVPIQMVSPTPLPPMQTHSEENLHPAHTGMPPISHGGPLFSHRDMHEMRDLRDIRDMRDIQDMRDLRASEVRPIELRDLRTGDVRDVRDLQSVDMREIRTPDVRDLRLPGLRDHGKVTSLTDLRDIRVPDMRLSDMRDIRSAHGDLRDVRDLRDIRDAHLSGPPLPSPVHETAPVTSHSVADLSPNSMTSSSNYPSSVPPGISTHHGAYPSTVTSPSTMPVHHYPYMYSNIPQNYDPHSGSPYVQQPQMNYYQ